MHKCHAVPVCACVCVCIHANAGAEEYVSMPREEKRKLYKCGKKYSTLENISTLKEDIESGSNETSVHLL